MSQDFKFSPDGTIRMVHQRKGSSISPSFATIDRYRLDAFQTETVMPVWTFLRPGDSTTGELLFRYDPVILPATVYPG